MVAGERADGDYRGTVALNVAVPGRSRELVLVALDLWDHGAQLRGAATVDREDPFWLPRSWKLTTDVGTTHASGGGGGGSMRWHFTFAPAVPDTARELRVFVGPDGERFQGSSGEESWPDHPTVVTALPGAPVPLQRVPATLEPAPVLTAAGRVPTLEGRAVGPDRVIPVSAQLDDVVGRDLNVLSIELYPTWFLLHIGGRGGLAGTRSGASLRHLRPQWTAQDDLGGHYSGTVKGAHSGWPWGVHAPFTPALDPAATRLVLSFPNPFGAGIVRTEVGLARAASDV